MSPVQHISDEVVRRQRARRRGDYLALALFGVAIATWVFVIWLAAQ